MLTSFGYFNKLVDYNVLNFKQIASVDTWVETLRISFGHRYGNSHLLKHTTISLSFKPDNERVDLAQGQYLDA